MPTGTQARQAWNLAADQQPTAVAFVEGADDVAEVVRFAGRHGLGVAGQGTGHGAVALGPLDDVILIKTERMRGVEVDAGRPNGAGGGRGAGAGAGEAAQRAGTVLPARVLAGRRGRSATRSAAG